MRLSWFMQVLKTNIILVKLEFGDVSFCGGKKTRAPPEKLSG